MTPCEQAAITYASRGWPVLPVVPGGKKPLTSHGFKEASTDPSVIRAWWIRWPDANVGVRTGPEAGIWVLDIDRKSDGFESWSAIALVEPVTLSAATGSGGRHLFFRWSDEHPVPSAAGHLPGIDTRGIGGYVVVSPSRLEAGGEYSWIDETVPVAEAPEWIWQYLRIKAKGHASQVLLPGLPVSESSPRGIAAGGRNQRLTEMAGAARRHGASAQSILALLSAENEARCNPPLDPIEVATIAESVANYEPPDDLHARTDQGNAERLVAMFGDRIRYCFDWNRWLVWDGTIWRPDERGEIRRLAGETVRAIYGSAAKVTNDGARAALVKHAQASEAYSRQRAMVEMAQPAVGCLIAGLDINPMLLSCRNGTVDLRTGELLQPRREDLITKQAQVWYDSTAECPTWIRFLNQIFNGDAALIRFVQKAFGYSLTADTSEQCLMICHGEGSNGKSTLLKTVQAILGDYAMSSSPATILAKRNDVIPNDVARLRGARMTTVLEIPQGRSLDESLVKGLTGGDVISARFLYCESFDMVPRFKLWLGTNHKPAIKGADHAIWRRMRLIPFAVKIPDDQQDKALAGKLLAEASGILRWMIDGCLAWQTDGLVPPAAVAAATADYRNAEDILGEFIDAVVAPDNDFSTPCQRLYDAYCRWSMSVGEKPQTQRWLNAQLEERGWIRRKTMTVRVWTNMSLTEAYVGVPE